MTSITATAAALDFTTNASVTTADPADNAPMATGTATTTSTTLPRYYHGGLNVEIPPSHVFPPPVDVNKLPLPVTKIPPHIHDLVGCAKHEIQSLLQKVQEEDALDDGFVICDLQVIRNKLAAWRLLFPRIKPFFALKCNPDPMVAAVLGQSGQAGFDCASVPEIHLALQSINKSVGRVAVEPDYVPIVYANPQRAEMDLDRALDLHVTALTFDGPEELYKVHLAYQKQLQNAIASANRPLPSPPNMIVRVLVPDEHSTVPLGEKFGAAPNSIERLTEMAVELGLPIRGVSFHCGSGNHDPGAYGTAIRLAAAAIETIDRIQQQQCTTPIDPCWLLDIGGGYPGKDGMGGDLGRFCGSSSSSPSSSKDNHDNSSTDKATPAGVDNDPHEETAAKIAAVVTPLVDELFPVQQDGTPNPVHIISEPGRYFVESAFVLCSRIYRVKMDRDEQGQVVRKHLFVAQGVQGVFKDCLLCNESFTPIPLSMNQEENRDSMNEERRQTPIIPCTVHGPSGEDYDVICQDYPLPAELDVGDWLLFDHMGAYTLSIAARNGKPPVRYVLGGGSSSRSGPDGTNG